MNSKLLFIFTLLVPTLAIAKINIVTTTPDLAYMARIIGGDEVKVHTLLEGSEDPHFADATPLFIQQTSNADLFVQVGLGLEEGWVPKVLSRSGNRKVQIEGEGLCTVGPAVDVLERPTGKIDRSMGDVHGEGNPHFHLGPDAFLQAAKKLYSCLNTSAPQSKTAFDRGFEALVNEVKQAKIEVQKIFQDKKNLKVAEYHKQFSYFFHEFKLDAMEPLEETPGVPPSAGRILYRAKKAQSEELSLMVATSYHNSNTLKKFQEISGVNYKVLPQGLLDNQEKNSYLKLLVEIAKSITDGK